MPRGGNNRKPTRQKVIEGHFRKDRATKNEPKPRPVKGDPPPWLDERGRRVWDRLAPIQERLGLLTEADGEAFATYCQAVARFEVALERLQRVEKIAGSDVDADTLKQIRSAEVSVEKAEHSLRMLSVEFGLTPAARSRISVPSDSGNDEMESLLNSG